MSDLRLRSITASIIGVIFLGTYFISAYLFSLLLLGILGWILYDEWPRVTGYSYQDPVYWGLSFLYPIFPFAVLIALVFFYRDLSYMLPLYPFIASWTVDAGAYFVGKRIGEHKMAPSISPGKTWEGLAGGIFALFVFHLMIIVSFHAHITILNVVISTILVGFCAVIGDLFMSWMKRRRKIKDTGHLLPGHGGLLDRFDSVLCIALGMGFVEVLKSLF